jgi:soluble lytic murein transglycosylase-like protein
MATINDLIANILQQSKKTYDNTIGAQVQALPPYVDSTVGVRARGIPPYIAALLGNIVGAGPIADSKKNFLTEQGMLGSDKVWREGYKTPINDSVALPAQAAEQGDTISGYAYTASPSADILKTILEASGQSKVDPALIAAILTQESHFKPDVRGDSDPNDRGIAQINSNAFPDVTDEQAFDPKFAIPFLATKIAEYLKYINGDINRDTAAWNVGRGGANINGP